MQLSLVVALVRRAALAAALIAAAPPLARSQGANAPAPAPPAAAPAACDSAAHHEFDFWIGQWEVRLPTGRLAGTNRIEPLLGGCVLQEHWRSAGGGHGTSLNFYDRTTRRWNQVWVDAQGGVLRLTGARSGEAMVLTGVLPDSAGAPVQQRITWTSRADGSVRQLWESSSDGRTWTTAFDGTYKRARP
jgi:hypothetical protein